jgi:hypothetical protein
MSFLLVSWTCISYRRSNVARTRVSSHHAILVGDQLHVYMGRCTKTRLTEYQGTVAILAGTMPYICRDPSYPPLATDWD